MQRLEPLVGEWIVDADFGVPEPGRMSFEWAFDGQFLLQRSSIPVPEAPDGLCLISPDPATGEFTQHYFDSRGVVRVYAMEFTGREWNLRRESADFSPLDFEQRFLGTLSEDGSRIEGAWEARHPGSDWEKDFDLAYARTGASA